LHCWQCVLLKIVSGCDDGEIDWYRLIGNPGIHFMGRAVAMYFF
jgi:hypothetical protein